MVHGTAATKGHLASNGGLRDHSVGDCFPFVVFAQGPLDALEWHVKSPNGTIYGPCESSQEASLLGDYLRSQI